MTEYLIVWGAVFAVMVIAELSTMQLVSIWFAAGAAAAFVSALFEQVIWVQLIIFAVVSILLLVFTRPLLKKITVKNNQPTNKDLDIGKTASVIEAIDNDTDKGRVKLNGTYWKAVSNDGSKIPEGTVVTITEIKGTKLFVSPLEK